MEEFKDEILTISYSSPGSDKDIELLKKVISLPGNAFIEKGPQKFYMYGCRSGELKKWPTEEIRSQLDNEVTALGHKIREFQGLIQTVRTLVDIIIAEKKKKTVICQAPYDLSLKARVKEVVIQRLPSW